VAGLLPVARCSRTGSCSSARSSRANRFRLTLVKRAMKELFYLLMVLLGAASSPSCAVPSSCAACAETSGGTGSSLVNCQPAQSRAGEKPKPKN
jgi:hypothetical protein